ncbi:MAG: biotin synthase BioB [Sporomusaceae bacterium]|nr:biotin synthase BioB [Sporomusaceae bacterium]
MEDTIIALGKKVLSGQSISPEEALSLTEIAAIDVPLLAAYANKIRDHFAGNSVELCGVINARSGQCSEDCKFCSQSVYYETNSPVYELLDKEEIVAKALEIATHGAKRTSLVTSGKGMENDPDFPALVTLLKETGRATGLAVCANLGTLGENEAKALKTAGIRRYAHNIETSERFYPSICTTHPYTERIATIKAAKAAGLELCTGGIIGLGESWEDRIAMAFTLKELDVDSVPLNILNPIPGTALADQAPLAPLEILQTFALFRFILPDKVIRPAGGREVNLRDLQGALLIGGANGLIIGNYLTFTGRNTSMDLQLVTDAGLTAK